MNTSSEAFIIQDKSNLEPGEVGQETPIRTDENLMSLYELDTIKLPKTQLRGPIELVIMKSLGSGKYGDVYEVKPKGYIPDYFPKAQKIQETTYALKIMKSLVRGKSSFEYEQMIMNAISAAYPNYRPPCAPHVLCYFDISKDKQGRFYLLSETMDGNLLEFTQDMKSKKEQISLALTTMKQVLAGLKELQEIGLLHRDLKQENILYHLPVGKNGRKQKSKVELKLADFGLSCIPKSENLPCGFKVTGTPGLIDPLILLKVFELKDETEKRQLDKLDELWDETNDIYSLAIILYELIFGFYLSNQEYEAILFRDEDIIKIMYKEAEERNVKKVKDLMKIYKEGSSEYKLFSFILRNMKSFERKQTIDEAINSLK